MARFPLTETEPFSLKRNFFLPFFLIPLYKNSSVSKLEMISVLLIFLGVTAVMSVGAMKTSKETVCGVALHWLLNLVPLDIFTEPVDFYNDLCCTVSPRHWIKVIFKYSIYAVLFSAEQSHADLWQPYDLDTFHWVALISSFMSHQGDVAGGIGSSTNQRLQRTWVAHRSSIYLHSWSTPES